MTAAALLADLEARGVHLEARGGHIACRFRSGVLTDRDRQAVAEVRADLLRLLQTRSGSAALPLLCLFQGPGGLPWESWLVAEDALGPLGELRALGARVHRGPIADRPVDRADLPAGRVAGDLLRALLAAAPPWLEQPGPELLARRAPVVAPRPLLWHRLQADSLEVLAPPPGPPPGLPPACPRCRSPRPRWALLEGGKRALCSRCWTPFDVKETAA